MSTTVITDVPGEVDFLVPRGTAKHYNLVVTAGTPPAAQDLTGASLTFLLKATVLDPITHLPVPDAAALLTLDNGAHGGIVVGSPATAGLATLSFASALVDDPVKFPEGVAQPYAVWLTLPNGDASLQAQGTLTVQTFAATGV